MNTAKKLLAFLMALILMVTAGCSQNGSDSAAEIYMEKAQKYIDTKDYAAAIDILQLGMETVEDNALSEMLAEVIELQIAESNGNAEEMPDTVNTSFDLSSYVSEVTYWATESTNWVYGGYALGIYIGEEFGDNVCFELSYIQAAPASRVAVAYAEIPLSEITGNEITYAFENDGWGFSGNVTLVLLEDSVEFTISNVEYTDLDCPEVWGFCNTMGYLISNPYVYDDLSYTQEEYDMLFGDDTTSEPTYDTSKASGILASLGMTEQEFRDSCFEMVFYSANLSVRDYQVNGCEMLSYPNDYVGYQVTLDKNVDGSNTAYYKVYDKGISTDGYTYYDIYNSHLNAIVRIYDFRDDVYSPTISADDYINPYMIFNGVQTSLSGNDYLSFVLICVDKW